jgi:hypothetical protein
MQVRIHTATEPRHHPNGYVISGELLRLGTGSADATTTISSPAPSGPFGDPVGGHTGVQGASQHPAGQVSADGVLLATEHVSDMQQGLHTRPQ